MRQKKNNKRNKHERVCLFMKGKISCCVSMCIIVTLVHTLNHRRCNHLVGIANVFQARSTMLSALLRIAARIPFQIKQRNDAIEQTDACARSTHMSKSRITMCQLFRTCEMPTEYAAHYLKIYRATVDSVSYPAHVHVPPPLRML